MYDKKSALMIIDMQKDFVLPDSPSCIPGAYVTIPNIQKILGSFRHHNLPIFHIVREYREDGSDIEKFRFDEFVSGSKCAIPNTVGCEVVDELKPVDGEYRIVKNRFSGFMNTELDLILRRIGVTDLFVTGTQYPNCVRATVFDAVALGYDVTVVTDATSAATKEIEAANIVDLKNIGVHCVSTTETIADELYA
ncbi:MAG: cysteine hydrolase [Gammaproteobacteria bacterium]|nr:cysteine hydrolase [Gammaproteobacteria bacterium]